jgi:hypothetical protein
MAQGAAIASAATAAASSLGRIDARSARAAIESVGYVVVDDVVEVEDIAAMRDFWLAEFARPHPPAPMVWGPYFGEPNGVVFDRSPTHCLYRSFDYLWNAPYDARTRAVALALNRVRNAIVGNEERHGELLNADRYGVYVTTSYYPPGDGWMWEHGDRMGELEHWHFILPLTFRGPDFTAGGLTLVDRAGNRVDVDSRLRPGSVVFYDGRLPHGVSRIVSDRTPPVGRLQMFAIPVLFEAPQTADRLIRSIPLARYARAKLSVAKRRLKRLAGR